MLRTVLTIVQMICAIGIVGLVLLQKGKGADAGAGFGAGASGTVFGARGARTALSRATAVLAAIFMINSLALAYMGSRVTSAAPSTIFDRASQSAPPAPAASTAPQPASPAPATEQSQIPAPAAADPGAPVPAPAQ